MIWNWHRDKREELIIEGPNREQVSAGDLGTDQAN